MLVMIISMVGLMSAPCPAAGGDNGTSTTTAAESSENCDMMVLPALSLENLLLFLLCTPCQVCQCVLMFVSIQFCPVPMDAVALKVER